MSLGKFLGNLSDWSNYSPRILFALTFICGVFLFGRSEFFTIIGLEVIQTKFRPYFGLGFLLFGSLFLSFPIVEAAKWIYKQGKEKFEHRKIERNYENLLIILTERQKSVLRSFMKKKTRTMQLNYEDGEVCELVNAQILYLPGDTIFFDRHKLDGMYTDFNLQPMVFNILKKRPELLD